MSSSVAQIRAVIDRLAADGTVTPEADGIARDVFPIAVPLDVGEVVRRWVRDEDARHTIEVGLAFGMSALHICQGLIENGHAGVRHVAIDPFQITGPDGRGFGRCGLEALGSAGVGQIVEHIEEESQTALPRLVREGRTFDFAFIDGNHRFDRVFLDLYFLRRLVRPTGIVVLDDYELPAITKAVAFFVGNRGWSIEESSSRGPHGWVVLRTGETLEDPPFTHFVDF
jgi:predicted O-methyltransferase YrrM